MTDGPVVADFPKDIREQLARELRTQGIEVSDDLSPWDIALRYFDFQMRMIPIKPRSVVRSTELSERALPDDLQAGVQAIVEDAVAGRDLSPYLSRQWKNMDRHDLLLKDWGVHHMHLGGRRIDSSGIVKRGGPLLFSFPTADSLYLIDVLDHNAFAAQRIVQILHDNWPQLIAHGKLPGISSIWPNDDETRRKLTRPRRSKPNGPFFGMAVEVSDGTAYGAIGGGYVTTGHSLDAVRRANALLTHAYDLQKSCVSAATEIRNGIQERTGTLLHELRLRVELTPDGVRVWETQSNVEIAVE
ncbi:MULTISPECIES: hypothetical protein [Sorangium]|uniref:Uncharacterized protein n=1 Tax=Sorangium cellulosum TaxID=56 RepID=A0A4P2QP49_SORCE|nr:MULTISPECIES: hypothetical protein [Sorangium]AUX31909.1 uncharacterized protein SOCE836_040440 [Sorangium cellulosum]WCQ91283.1 hypothetical protein NQZ70_03999 [Sorangium sp. Soce836]